MLRLVIGLHGNSSEMMRARHRAGSAGGTLHRLSHRVFASSVRVPQQEAGLGSLLRVEQRAPARFDRSLFVRLARPHSTTPRRDDQHMSDKSPFRVYLSDKKEAVHRCNLAWLETTMHVLVTGATRKVRRRPVELLIQSAWTAQNLRRTRYPG